MAFDWQRVLDDLARLRDADKKLRLSGAIGHGYRLNAPLTEATVARFEKRHGIALPADYRQFLLEVGNGGAGPYYGVFPLGTMDDSFGLKSWKKNDGFVGDPSQPFPYRKAWNDLTGMPEYNEPNRERHRKDRDAFERRYWHQLNGAIPLCHEGCAYRDWLVVTGAEAGRIWYDARNDDAGLSPVMQGGRKRVTFYQWYRDWLDDGLVQWAKRRR